MTTPPPLIHATLISSEQRGALLIGASGTGKSDLALRLISINFTKEFCNQQPQLIADDQVELLVSDGKLYGQAPKPLQGLLEVHNLGIVKVPYGAKSEINLCVQLTPGQNPERLPPSPPPTKKIEGVSLPLIKLDPHQQTSPQKLLIALKQFSNASENKSRQ